MTKEEFSKLCEEKVRELFAKAREIDKDIYGLTLELGIKDNDYESFRTSAFALIGEEEKVIDYRIKTHHFTTIYNDGTRKDTEEVA